MQLLIQLTRHSKVLLRAGDIVQTTILPQPTLSESQVDSATVKDLEKESSIVTSPQVAPTASSHKSMLGGLLESMAGTPITQHIEATLAVLDEKIDDVIAADDIPTTLVPISTEVEEPIDILDPVIDTDEVVETGQTSEPDIIPTTVDTTTALPEVIEPAVTQPAIIENPVTIESPPFVAEDVIEPAETVKTEPDVTPDELSASPKDTGLLEYLNIGNVVSGVMDAVQGGEKEPEESTTNPPPIIPESIEEVPASPAPLIVLEPYTTAVIPIVQPSKFVFLEPESSTYIVGADALVDPPEDVQQENPPVLSPVDTKPQLPPRALKLEDTADIVSVTEPHVAFPNIGKTTISPRVDFDSAAVSEAISTEQIEAAVSSETKTTEKPLITFMPSAVTKTQLNTESTSSAVTQASPVFVKNEFVMSNLLDDVLAAGLSTQHPKIPTTQMPVSTRGESTPTKAEAAAKSVGSLKNPNTTKDPPIFIENLTINCRCVFFITDSFFSLFSFSFSFRHQTSRTFQLNLDTNRFKFKCTIIVKCMCRKFTVPNGVLSFPIHFKIC